MLTGGTDSLYRRALATPHVAYFRIDVFSGTGTLLKENLTYFSGSVSATLANRVSRTCDFTVHESLYPAEPTDLLAPYGNFIRAYRGVRLGDGSLKYVWQVFEGRIQDASVGSDGSVSISCSDRSADVVDNSFRVPQNSTPGLLATTQIQQLITDGFPGATFGTFDSFDQVMPQLTWESDRGGALDEIAQSLGAYWYPTAEAKFVLHRIPWTVVGNPVVTLSSGDGGTITGYSASRSRSDVYNVYVVTGERSDGTTPVYATASDMNPASPTNINGGFGIRSRDVHLQTPSTQGSVQSVANDLLQSSIALTENWNLASTPDASLELGDVINIQAAGRDVVQVVSAFTLPLDFSGPMSITARSQVVGLLEVQ
jgi:hypothetical protein